jgi:hypothetical protein
MVVVMVVVMVVLLRAGAEMQAAYSIWICTNYADRMPEIFTFIDRRLSATKISSQLSPSVHPVIRCQHIFPIS